MHPEHHILLRNALRRVLNERGLCPDDVFSQCVEIDGPDLVQIFSSGLATPGQRNALAIALRYPPEALEDSAAAQQVAAEYRYALANGQEWGLSEADASQFAFDWTASYHEFYADGIPPGHNERRQFFEHFVATHQIDWPNLESEGCSDDGDFW